MEGRDPPNDDRPPPPRPPPPRPRWAHRGSFRPNSTTISNKRHVAGRRDRLFIARILVLE
jgi:hypothetical protein